MSGSRCRGSSGRCWRFGGLTLLSAAFSPQPRVSLVDTKQLVLFLIVPLTYRFAMGRRGSQILTVIVSVGAASAAFGIIQYNILHYDQLDQRVRGTLGHYMTYSGLLMLVIGAALARVLFGTARPHLVRAGHAGAGRRGGGVLHQKRGGRYLCGRGAAVLAEGPAPDGGLSDRRRPGSRAGAEQRHGALPVDVQPQGSDHPRPDGHASRRGAHDPVASAGSASDRTWSRRSTPSIAIPMRSRRSIPTCTTCRCRSPPSVVCRRWPPGSGSSASSCSICGALFRADRARVLAAAALAAMAAMLGAGMFEYNFGDSEFLMLLLLRRSRCRSPPPARLTPTRPHDHRAARPAPRAGHRLSPARPPRPGRRRRHARPLHRRRRDAHLA